MKILHLLNEVDEIDLPRAQIGPHKALEVSHRYGTIADLACYPDLPEYHKLGDARKAQHDLITVVKSLQPDAIIRRYVSKFPVDQSFVSNLIDESIEFTDWVKANLSTEVMYRRIIDMCKDGLAPIQRNAYP